MSRLLIHDYPLMVSPKLATRIGLEGAHFIQQIHFLCENSRNIRDGKRWVYNTYEQWVQHFPFWDEAKIGRIVRNLEKLGLLITSRVYNRMPMDKTKWYRVNYASELLNFSDEQDADLNVRDTNLNDEDAKMHVEDTNLHVEDTPVNDEATNLYVEDTNLNELLPQTYHIDYHIDLTTKDCRGASATTASDDGDFDLLADEPVSQTKAKAGHKASEKAGEGVTVPTWAAYRAAYLQAYGCEPLRNAKVNGQISQFVKLVGADKAPHIAAFFVHHPNHWYRTKGHDFGTLLANAQAVAVDWQRNMKTTSVETKRQEQTAANMSAAQRLIEKYEREAV